MKAGRLSDIELVQLIREGDRAAYEIVYNSYALELTRYAEAKLGDWDEAEDVIHDLFVDVWKKKEGFFVTTSIKVYLYGATKHLIINRIRKAIVRRTYREEYQKGGEPVYCVESEMAVRELERRVELYLSQLPEKTQHIFRESRNSSKKIKDIAENFALSEQTIKNQISIAIKHLKKYISLFFL